MRLIVSVGFCAFWYLYLLQSSLPRAENAEFAGNPEGSSILTGYLARPIFRKKPGYNIWHTAQCKVCPTEGRALIAGRGTRFPSCPKKGSTSHWTSPQLPTPWTSGVLSPAQWVLSPAQLVLPPAQLVKLSEIWPKLKFPDFHEMIKNLAEGQKKVPRRMKMYV